MRLHLAMLRILAAVVLLTSGGTQASNALSFASFRKGDVQTSRQLERYGHHDDIHRCMCIPLMKSIGALHDMRQVGHYLQPACWFRSADTTGGILRLHHVVSAGALTDVQQDNNHIWVLGLPEPEQQLVYEALKRSAAQVLYSLPGGEHHWVVRASHAVMRSLLDSFPSLTAVRPVRGFAGLQTLVCGTLMPSKTTVKCLHT
jgi:hypothetical protein